MFDLNTSILDPEYHEELDEQRLEEYINALMEEFAESPEAAEFVEAFETSIGCSATWMHYAGQYFCATPATITPGDADEILFEIFPRKVSVEADAAGEIIAELRAFWQFLKRTRAVDHADAILELLTDDGEDRLRDELADPENFGLAKSFFTAGDAAGFDMTTQEGLDSFMLAYNAAQLAKRDPGFPDQTDDGFDGLSPAVAPIRKRSSRVGRNAPCPCGSGRKYKKCCGR